MGEEYRNAEGTETGLEKLFVIRADFVSAFPEISQL
jgi:hypothetical protein